jgi:iron-sulfur cluster assembly accessory protein
MQTESQKSNGSHAPIFSITPRAASHVLSMMEKEGLEGQGLRIAVVTGGCSGFEYSLGFRAGPEPGDSVVEAEGLRVFVDTASVAQLSGSVLDYVSGLYGGGLKFLNPNAVHSCGCGTSFSTK